MSKKNDSPVLILIVGVCSESGESEKTQSKSSNAAYRDNYDAIFGKKEETFEHECDSFCPLCEDVDFTREDLEEVEMKIFQENLMSELRPKFTN